MAIDTAAKRFSIMEFLDTSGGYGVLPDGTIGTSDRASLLELYAGLALAALTFGAVSFRMRMLPKISLRNAVEPAVTIDVENRPKLRVKVETDG